MRRKPSTIWKMYEWEYFSKLLIKGYPVLDGLKILQKDVGSIELQLVNGVSMTEILLPFATVSLQRHLRFFMQITSLPQAIACSIRMMMFEQNMRSKLKKECSYPVFIFLFAYATLFLFLQFVIPQLLLSFPMETLDTFFVAGILFLKLLCGMLGFLLSGLLFLILLWKHIQIPRCLLEICCRVSVVKEYISYLFSSYMMELDQDGVSTQKAITFLCDMQHHKLFSVFLADVKFQIEQGRELLEIMAAHSQTCPMFQTCFTIGVKTGMLAASLLDYVQFQQERWVQKLHRVSITVQCISYGFVGFLVIMVYQIMLVPLQLLETM